MPLAKWRRAEEAPVAQADREAGAIDKDLEQLMLQVFTGLAADCLSMVMASFLLRRWPALSIRGREQVANSDVLVAAWQGQCSLY